MRRRTDQEMTKNGAPGARVPWLATAGGSPAIYDDPMSKVLGLDAKTSSLTAWFGFTSGSTLLLVGLMALASVVAWVHTAHGRLAASAPEEIDVMKEDVPPPPPPRAEPEAKPEPVALQRPQREAPPPPPAPAQAAKVIAQEPDPNEPVDLTGNTIVQGNADAYAGGFTTGNGTSTNAVRAAAVAGGVPGGTGPVRPAPQLTATDRSRAASVGATEWNAPFPPEADAAQIDDAYVMLQVDVRPDGRAAAVRVLSDPGNGFGREARQYAMKQRYSPALDREGDAIASTTNVRVHFSR